MSYCDFSDYIFSFPGYDLQKQLITHPTNLISPLRADLDNHCPQMTFQSSNFCEQKNESIPVLSDVIFIHFWFSVSLSHVCADIIYHVDKRGECPNLTTPQKTPIFMCCLSFNRMVEPSPSALHLISGGDVSMAGVGVKIEQEESCRGRGLTTSMETVKASPSRDWSGSHPLEVRQLTPPLSCSPSVRRPGSRKVAETGKNCQ